MERLVEDAIQTAISINSNCLHRPLPCCAHPLQGNLIGLAKERLPVVVTFTAQRPVSFTASIDFMVGRGGGA